MHKEFDLENITTKKNRIGKEKREELSQSGGGYHHFIEHPETRQERDKRINLLVRRVRRKN